MKKKSGEGSAAKIGIGGNLSLEEVEAMYGSLIESLPAIVYVVEPLPPYAPIYVSPRIETFGYTLSEWLRVLDTWLNIIHPDDREWVLRQTEESIAQAKENDYEYRVIAKDDSVHWVHDCGKFVLDESGKPIYWQGVLLDITLRKQAEEERENLIEQLRQTLAQVKTLSGLLPICASCKSVRDDKGYWQQIESYLTEHTEAIFSHSICQSCTERLYPQYYKTRHPDAASQE